MINGSRVEISYSSGNTTRKLDERGIRDILGVTPVYITAGRIQSETRRQNETKERLTEGGVRR